MPARIAFGSCGHQDKPHPVLKTVLTKQPDLFVYLGDNIYGDTEDMAVLQAKYNQLGTKPEFQALRANTSVLSIWDDHDYGANDAGKEYPFKEESKQVFLDFWQVPDDSPRRSHPGIYGSHLYSDGDHTLQVILLDTRTFRDPLAHNPKEPVAPHKNDYRPDPSPDKTLLGDAQWTWLESELKKPADLRIVASSIQFGHEYNGWESWTNLPAEQQRFLDLIKKTRANGVVFISGDVHWGEISLRHPDGLYPIHDVTASGITQDWHNTEPNKFRQGQPVRENHFGLISVDWQKPDPEITLQVIDKPGTTRLSKTVRLSEISFPE
ncbi:MAG: alkaline phosphatase D family protein [Verrucomicrobiales bacterium]|nr:alkaline phosphatase D family protein [Verrucomicrobiales bacterium]